MVTTIDMADPEVHPLWDIVPFGPRFPTERAAQLAVVEAAKTGSVLHREALHLVYASRARPVKPQKASRSRR